MVKARDIIPMYIQSSSWECNYSLKSFVKTINGFVTEYGLDLNPDFQRGHVWNEAQQVAYVEHILKGGKTAKVVYFNYPAWIRHVEPGEYADFVCVDGLQRITAIHRFVQDEITVFGGYHFSEIEDIRIMGGMLININDLSSRADVLQWYIEFNSGGTPHTQKEIDRVKALLRKERC